MQRSTSWKRSFNRKYRAHAFNKTQVASDHVTTKLESAQKHAGDITEGCYHYRQFNARICVINSNLRVYETVGDHLLPNMNIFKDEPGKEIHPCLL